MESMTGKEIIKALRELADGMEAYKPDHDLVHRLAVDLVAWDRVTAHSPKPLGSRRCDSSWKVQT